MGVASRQPKGKGHRAGQWLLQTSAGWGRGDVISGHRAAHLDGHSRSPLHRTGVNNKGLLGSTIRHEIADVLSGEDESGRGMNLLSTRTPSIALGTCCGIAGAQLTRNCGRRKAAPLLLCGGHRGIPGNRPATEVAQMSVCWTPSLMG